MIIPNATIIYGGVLRICVLATTHKIFMIPKEQLSGAGLINKRTTFTIGGKSAVEGLNDLQASMNERELEENLYKIITQDWGLPGDDFILHPKEMPEFSIKFGLLSKGIYYKRTPQERRKAIAGVSKADLQKLQELYGF